MEQQRQPSPPCFTRPLIHTITTPDLEALLSTSSSFNSLSSLLSPFSACPLQSPTLNNVQVRTPPNHEPRIVNHFSIEFKEKVLPLGWDTTTTNSSSGGGGVGMKREASLGISNMSQGEKDELYLDQLSEKIINEQQQPSSSHSHLPVEVQLDPTRLYPKKQQYDLEGNRLEQVEEQERVESEEWETKTLDDLTPWYRQFRQQVFKRRETVEFETWGWPVGCILALSTNHPDPLNALSLLWDLTSPNQLYSSSTSTTTSSHESEFVNPDILRYILIIHDMRTTTNSPSSSQEEREDRSGMSWEQVLKLEETVKKTYGVHTKILSLYDHYQPLKSPAELKLEQEQEERGGMVKKSLEEELEKLWPTTTSSEEEIQLGGSSSLIGLGYTPTTNVTTPGQKKRLGSSLSLKDLDSLSLFLREFVTQSLIPYLERTITLYNEQFNSSKKSLGGRLFSVGRKYFGASASSSSNSPSGSQGNTRAGSPVTGGSQMGYNSSRGYYSYQSQESQSRRLGDLLFMFRDYKLAFQVYGEVSKDFKNDRAWKHFSSSIRMQGLCQLLLVSTTPSSSINLTGSNSPDYLLQSSILPTSTASSGAVNQVTGSGGASSSSVDFDLLRSTMLYHEYYSLLPSPSTTNTNNTTSRLSSNSLMRLVDLSIEKTKRGGGGVGTGGAGAGGVSDSDDELWTAMICEQSALSQLGITNSGSTITIERKDRRTSGRRRERKFVLEMCLAGIRYEKSGLKSLSRRCLSQASSLYSLPSTSPSTSTALTLTAPATFTSIKTYLHHSLARQAYNASKPLDAIYHFLKLLPPPTTSSTTTTSTDTTDNEGMGSLDWLDDFTLAWELLGTTTTGTTNDNSSTEESGEGEEYSKRRQKRAEKLIKDAGIELGSKLFDSTKVKISRRVINSTSSSSSSSHGPEKEGEEEWRQLENFVLMDRGGGELKGKLSKNQALVGETFYLELPIRNPLEAFLSIGDLTVQTNNENDDVRNELQIDQSLDGQVIELAPLESRIIYVPIKGSTAKTYQFDSISYKFHNLLPVLEPLSFPGSFSTNSTRHNTKTKTTSTVQFPTVELLNPIPILSLIEIEKLPQRLLHGQLETRKIRLKNTGQVTIRGLRGVCSNPEIGFFNSGNSGEAESPLDGAGGDKVKVDNVIKKNQVEWLMKEDEELGPGEEVELGISLRGNQVGEKLLKWLFIFESPAGEVFSTRFEHKLEISPSLEFRYTTRPSSNEQYPFILDIEAYNSGIPTEDLCITSISTLSPFWRISSLLPTTTTTITAGEEVLSTPIRWQQISNLVLAIDRVENGLEQCKKSINWSVEQIESLLQGKKIEEGNKIGEIELNFSKIGDSSDATKLTSGGQSQSQSTLLRSILNSHSHERSNSLSSSFPMIPPHLLSSLFALFSPTSTLIFIEYSSPSLNLTSTHFLPLPTLGASRNYLEKVLQTAELKAGGLYVETQRERSLLIKSLRESELGREMDPSIVFLRVEEEVCREHDFSKGPCLVPVHFLIRNLSPTSSFSYTLTLGTTTDSALVYTGLLTRRNKIEPLSIDKVSTKVFITREGLYDVGGWNLESKTEEGGGRIWKREGEKRELRVEGKRQLRGNVAVGGGTTTGRLIDVV